MFQRHLVLSSYARDCLINFAVTHLDAGGGGALNLNTGQNQPIEYLLFDLSAWRQLAVVLCLRLRQDIGHSAVQFTLQYHVFVDHGHNLVQRFDRNGLSNHRRSQYRGGQARTENQ